MLIKATIAAAILAASIGGGTIAVHKFADLQQADNVLLALASPGAIASPDAPAKLAAAGERLQKVAGTTSAPKAQAPQWTSIAQWGRQ